MTKVLTDVLTDVPGPVGPSGAREVGAESGGRGTAHGRAPPEDRYGGRAPPGAQRTTAISSPASIG